MSQDLETLIFRGMGGMGVQVWAYLPEIISPVTFVQTNFFSDIIVIIVKLPKTELVDYSTFQSTRTLCCPHCLSPKHPISQQRK